MDLEYIMKVWLVASKFIVLRYFLVAGSFYVLFYVIFRNKWMERKLQRIFPSRNSQVSEILHSAASIAVFSLMAGFVFKIAPNHTNLYFKIEDFGWLYLIVTFPLMFFIHDTYFYWVHRFMHLPIVFKYVHLIHHKSTNPTPWTSYSFHVLESILEAGILPLIAFTLPVHKGALIFFMLLQFIYNVYGHLGFELFPKGFHKTKVGKWVNTSVAHNMHHKYFNNNYGLYFLFWDRWMGTLDQRYDQHFEKQKID